MDLLALDKQVCFALAVASRSVVAMYRPILEPLGLTHPQYLVMLSLWERDGRSLSELSKTLYLEPATLSPLVKRLQSAGLVLRERRSDDERAVSIHLTESGRALRERAEQVPLAVIETLGWRIEELESLRDALTRLIADAGAAARR